AALMAGGSACPDRADDGIPSGTAGTRGAAGAAVARERGTTAAASAAAGDQNVPTAVGQAGAGAASPAVSAVGTIVRCTKLGSGGEAVPARSSGQVRAHVHMEGLLGRDGNRRADLSTVTTRGSATSASDGAESGELAGLPALARLPSGLDEQLRH